MQQVVKVAGQQMQGEVIVQQVVEVIVQEWW